MTGMASTAESAESGKASENISELRKYVVHTHSGSAETTSPTAQSGMSELIVSSPLLFVTQDIISFCRFFKFLLRLFVARIFIGMIL